MRNHLGRGRIHWYVSLKRRTIRGWWLGITIGPEGPSCCWLLLKLEGGRRGRRADGSDIDTLSGQNLIEFFELEARNVTFEQGLALGELVLNALSVSPRGQCLAVPVFLVTGSARRCAGCTSWVL